MDHLLLSSTYAIFHNIFKNLVFQRCQKALLWSKGLVNVVPYKLQEEMQLLTQVKISEFLRVKL